MLSTVFFLVCAACIVVAQVVILRFTLASALADRGDMRISRTHRAVEVTWAVLPAIGLAVVLSLTWAELGIQPAPPPPAPAIHDAHEARES
ncbi:MAG: hypothetical protein ACT4PJ_10950 [Gemmatimonadaceae bacterium]